MSAQDRSGPRALLAVPHVADHGVGQQLHAPADAVAKLLRDPGRLIGRSFDSRSVRLGFVARVDGFGSE